MRPLYDFPGVLGQWIKDGDTDGYLIEYEIKEPQVDYSIPHPLGRKPVKIEQVYSNILTFFSVSFIGVDEIRLCFADGPGIIRLRIE